MATQPNSRRDLRESVALKIDEPEVEPQNPWGDDLLGRQEIATRITNLAARHTSPLTISLHGQWGSGKTFMLRRWQKDLENQGFKAIYFNAWEDDFCDDPLLATIGQLSNYFKETGLEALARTAADYAIPLILENLTGILKTSTGVTISLDRIRNRKKTLIDTYLDQRASKDELKKMLSGLSQQVANDTGHPMIFIVDELDRCRPTFAVELLERVKHIFDVPHIVFVFGINRNELCKSLMSIYGEIDSDVYLRRFFDFEFDLHEADPERYCRQLMVSFHLDQFARTLNGIGAPSYSFDFQNFISVCPRLWSSLNLSLRDMNYGVRLLALLTRNIPQGGYTHPYLLALLIGFKFNNRELYHSLISGNFKTSQIIEYLLSETGSYLTGSDFVSHLDRIEGFLYCADEWNYPNNRNDRGFQALFELGRVTLEEPAIVLEVTSERAQNSREAVVSRISQAIVDGQQLGIDETIFGRLAELIDTYQGDLRR